MAGKIKEIKTSGVPQQEPLTVNLFGAQAQASGSFQSSSSSVNKTKTVDVSHRSLMRKTTYQARLGRRLDRIARKVIDNQIRLTSHPTDMLRIKAERDVRSGDLIARTFSDSEIIPVVLPPMKDIPVRQFLQKNNSLTIPSLYPLQEQTYFEIYTPLEMSLDEDDLLVRIIYDDTADRNYVMIFQVKEILGTLGYSSFRYHKFWVTLYDEKLSDSLVKILKEASEKRDILGW